MDEIETAVAEVNEFLAEHLWCDFTVVRLSHNLVIGGRTGLSRGHDVYDITVTFDEVFFAQVLTFWEMDTDAPAFVVPDIEEQRRVNLAYAVEEGRGLVRIVAADVPGPMYVSATGMSVRYDPA